MHDDGWDASAGGDLEAVAMHAPGVWVAHEHHGVGEIVDVAPSRIRIRFAGGIVTVAVDAFGPSGFVMLGHRLH